MSSVYDTIHPTVRRQNLSASTRLLDLGHMERMFKAARGMGLKASFNQQTPDHGEIIVFCTAEEWKQLHQYAAEGRQ